MSKNITTRPRRPSRNDCGKNFYLNKTVVIIHKHLQSGLTLEICSKKPVKCYMETPFEENMSDRLRYRN